MIKEESDRLDIIAIQRSPPQLSEVLFAKRVPVSVENVLAGKEIVEALRSKCCRYTRRQPPEIYARAPCMPP